jgi:hypothetical protein
MAEPQKDPEVKEMTAAQAAKLVFRPPVEPDGKPIPIKAAEVLSFRDYGDRVVVVTLDGQKFSAEKAAK